MNDDPSKRRLGRGLAALIGEMDQPIATMNGRPGVSADRKVPIELVSRNPKNPRKNFGETELHPDCNEAESINGDNRKECFT